MASGFLTRARSRAFMSPMPFRRRLAAKIGSALVAAGLVLAPLTTAENAQATVVEKIVAVVGSHAIFLSDLRARARPLRRQIYAKVPPGAQRNAIESDMYKKILARMIDEQLEDIVAKRAKINVSPKAIDDGIRRIAAPQKLTPAELIAEAVRQGYTVQGYREEVRRQIIERELINLRVKKRVRISKQDVRIGYEKLKRRERKQLGYRLQWIVLHIPEEASAKAKAKRLALADSLVARAKAGEKFEALAKQYSDEGNSAEKGGDLGPAKPGDLPKAIEAVAMKLERGEVSTAFRYRDTVAIVRVLDRQKSKLPPLSKAEDQVAAQVYGARLEKAKRAWLKELKKSIFVDVRY